MNEKYFQNAIPACQGHFQDQDAALRQNICPLSQIHCNQTYLTYNRNHSGLLSSEKKERTYEYLDFWTEKHMGVFMCRTISLDDLCLENLRAAKVHEQAQKKTNISRCEHQLSKDFHKPSPETKLKIGYRMFRQ